MPYCSLYIPLSLGASRGYEPTRGVEIDGFDYPSVPRKGDYITFDEGEIELEVMNVYFRHHDEILLETEKLHALDYDKTLEEMQDWLRKKLVP